MKRSNTIFVLSSMVYAVLLLMPGKAQAISAFTRQYNVECSTCHDPYAHRTEFGEAFLRNGYVWPSKEEPKKPEGAKESYWVAGLVDSIPLSLTFRHNLAYDDQAETDKLSPDTQFQIHAGGNIKGYVGFFAHDLTSKNSEAFAVFRLQDLLKLPVSFRYGRIIPQTILWKPNQTYLQSPYATQTLSIAGEPALGAVRDGLEMDVLLGHRLFIAGGVTDRKDQDQMEYYGHAACKIGGTAYSGEEPEVDFDHESVWDYLSVTLGGYGYKGYTKSLDNEYWRAGGDLELRYKSLTLMTSYQFAREGKDSEGREVDTITYMAEADFYYMSQFLLAARYERQDQGSNDDAPIDRVTAGVGFTPLQNLWLRLEGSWTKSRAEKDDETTMGSLYISYHL